MSEASSLASRLTIIVPTYNRPADLARLLGYLARAPIAVSVLVFDSSNPPARMENRALAQRAGANTQYREFDASTPPFAKFAAGAGAATTPYSVLCADDDLLLLDRLIDVVAILDGAPDAVAAHGRYLGFVPHRDSIEVTRLVYASPSIDAEDGLGRLVQLMRSYEAATYAVYRTEALRSVLAAAARMPSTMFAELAGAVTAASQGKLIRLQPFTHARNLAPSHAYRYWHPLEYIYPAPAKLFADYHLYRTEMLAALGAALSSHKAMTFDWAHLAYFRSYLPPAVIAHYLDASIAGLDDKTAIERAWPLLYTRGFGPLDQMRGMRSVRFAAGGIKNILGAARLLVPARWLGEIEIAPVRFSREFLAQATPTQEERQAIARAFALYRSP